MKELIIYLRCMQLFYNNCHNQTSRVAFFADHDAFSSFYSECESDYDGSVERFIGLFGDIDLVNIQELAVQKLKSYPSAKDNAAMFSFGLSMEKELCQIIEKLCLEKYSQGVKQMMGDIAQRSEIRSYKAQQRIKK